MPELRLIVEHDSTRTPVPHRPGSGGRRALLLHSARACTDHRSTPPLLKRLDAEVDALPPALRDQGASRLSGRADARLSTGATSQARERR